MAPERRIIRPRAITPTQPQTNRTRHTSLSRGPTCRNSAMPKSRRRVSGRTAMDRPLEHGVAATRCGRVHKLDAYPLAERGGGLGEVLESERHAASLLYLMYSFSTSHESVGVWLCLS